MDNLPIDIHSTKLLDWLISRRHCKKEWPEAVAPVREKIGNAIKDMPESEEILSLLKGAWIDYWRCKQIVALLRETEKDSKNIFGYYSSQRMKDWQEILSLYERNGVYLAEGAHLLQRAVQYEVPGLRRQIARAEQTVGEAGRKQEEYLKLAAESKRAYERELAQLGVKGGGGGGDVRSELLQQAKAQLPQSTKHISEGLGVLAEAVEYYTRFGKYVGGKEVEGALPLVKALMKRGGDDPMTVFEWKHGHRPDIIEERVIETEMKQKKEEAEEINFDLDDGGDEQKVEGIELVAEESLEDQPPTTPINTTAREREALWVLEDVEGMAALLSELEELECFLAFRLIDERDENVSDIYLSGMDDKPVELRQVNPSTIEDWLKRTRHLCTLINDPQKAVLRKIWATPGHVEDIAGRLEQKRLLEPKYHRLHELAIEKQSECISKIQSMHVLLEELIDATKSLQEQVEADLSKKYNGREVYLIGEINAVLYA